MVDLAGKFSELLVRAPMGAQLRKFLKAVLPPILIQALQARLPRKLPDRQFYRPFFSPWDGFGDFAEVIAAVRPFSLVTADRIWMLRTLARQACNLPGNFWECGVYKGGTAMMLASVVSASDGKRLRLFDTFSGMPEINPVYDNAHKRGDFSDTTLDDVRQRVGDGTHLVYHPGLIPETFSGLEGERIAFAHIDVDIYQSVIDCCAFIYPRLSGGGFMIFDDYGAPSCAGARKAVDKFFDEKPEYPLTLPTGQAIIVKVPNRHA